MKKKLLSLALVLVMALTLLPTAAFAEGGADPDGLPEQSEPNTLPPADDPDNDIQPLDVDSGVTPTGTCTHTGTKWIATQDGKCQEVCTEDSCREKDGTPQEHTPDNWETTPEKHSRKCSKCNTVIVAEAAHTFNSTTGKCTVCQYECLHNNLTTGTCSICQKVLSTSSDPSPTCSHPNAPGTMTQKNTPKDATCVAEGEKAYYQCESCHKYFIAGALGTALDNAPDAAALKIPATGNHTAPSDGTGSAVDASTHTYTCTVCKTSGHSGTHTYDSNNICTVCGFHGTPSSSYRYIDISSAYVNSYSISVTWASDLPDGTSFEIYVDGSWRTTVTPSKSGSYFSATVSSSRYLDDSYYYVAVYRSGDHTIGDSVRVYGRYYDGDYDYWYDHYYPNSTPGTNSHGIPYASQVNGRYSASEAIRILRNKNANDLQNELMGSSSARDSYDSLERAVKNANNVSVTVSTDRSGVPSALRSGAGIQISGAAFNASRTNSTVRLVVDAPSVNRYTGRGYQFSMTLTGVDSASRLDVPVVVSMPLPSDINSNFVRVLHYHNSNIPTVIIPQVSGGRIRFPLTGFSDFVITDNGVPSYTYISDGYGGYYVPVGQVARRSLAEEQLSVALPIIASLPASGYVFDDVSGTYWASGEIAWARDSGILSGYYDGSFRPYAATTRQELWMVLARLSGASPADMRAAREWAMNAGITDGTKPESPLSTQQMIAMLYRYASYRGMNLAAPSANLSLYRDGASVSTYARTPMSWAINRGIVTGNGTSYLHPQDIATRADFAVYLYRFLQ